MSVKPVQYGISHVANRIPYYVFKNIWFAVILRITPYWDDLALVHLHSRGCGKWTGWDLNPRPLPCQDSDLPADLPARGPFDARPFIKVLSLGMSTPPYAATGRIVFRMRSPLVPSGATAPNPSLSNILLVPNHRHSGTAAILR